MFLNVFGSLGIFIYGIYLLSRSLRKITSKKIKEILNRVDNKYTGIAIGAMATSVLQSSSAVSAIVISMADAGLIKLATCIGIIFGANIGTTFTAQIIAFKASNLALPLVGLGVLLFFVRNRKIKKIGEILIGLGMVFLGLKLMGGYLKIITSYPIIKQALIYFGKVPFFGVVAGAIITTIVQSSSAVTGLIIVLADLGSLDVISAFSLILGANIGTTVTAQLAAIGKGKTARKIAWIHTVFNVTGSLYMLLLMNITIDGMPIFLKFVELFTPANNISRFIANSHTAFNIINVIILLPFVNLILKCRKDSKNT